MAIYDPTTPDEVWYPIPSLPGYQLSSNLRVRSFWIAHPGSRGQINPKKWRLIKISMKFGYPVIWTYLEGRSSAVKLHRIIAELAYGPVERSRFVIHFDDDKENCYPSNLSHGGRLVNARDAIRNGRTPRGETHPSAKLTETQVREIRQLLAHGHRQKDIASRFGIARQTVGDIRARRKWDHLV